MMTPGSIWWQHITGPRTFVARVAQAVRDRRVPLLSLPPDFPYLEPMRGAVEDAIEERFGKGRHSCVTLDAEDDCPSGLLPDMEDLLLGKLADRETRNGYREKDGPVQRYLSATGSLEGKIVWVKGMPESQIGTWLRLVAGFGEPGGRNGIFLLESRHGFPEPPRGGSFEVVEFSSLSRRQNVQLFSSILLADREDLDPPWRDYMAAAAARLCGHDAELSEALLEQGDWREASPVALLAELRDDERFERRGHEEDSEHALALARRGELDRLGKRLWEAQIETLFPRIERFRLDAVERLRPELASLLAGREVRQFGVPVEDPEDLELCTLKYLLNQWKGGRYWLTVSPALRGNVERLCECRNRLAHRECCDPDQVDLVLGLSREDREPKNRL